MYQEVAGSRGPRQQFTVTCGLQEGYGPSGRLHALTEATEVVFGELKAAAAEGRPYLTGTILAGEVVYAWPEGPGQAGGGHEPVVVYSGEVNPLYNADLLDDRDAVVEILNALAAALGAALGQTRIYLAYDGELWVLEREAASTPTGD